LAVLVVKLEYKAALEGQGFKPSFPINNSEAISFRSNSERIYFTITSDRDVAASEYNGE